MLSTEHLKQVMALEKYLDRHDELLKASRAQYQTYRGDQIEDLPFQKTLIDAALNAKREWAAEVATGAGKSIVSARIALDRLGDGPVLYICPNRTAIGDLSTGIINKFMRVAETFSRRPVTLGKVNELSRANDVSFVTPYMLSYMLQHNRRAVQEMLKRASCLIVDEAHHFPEDADDELKIYGTIYDAADRLVRDGLTVSMTGTWERLDRLSIMGKEAPDVRVTVQDVVDLGRCPEIYGVQVITDVTAKKAQVRGDLYDLHLSPKERKRYLDGVASCMLTTRRRYPVPFAGFVRTAADAHAIVDAYNGQLRRTERRLGLLLSTTPMRERLMTVQAIEQGQLAGYVTCAVGEEALDLPRLEVVHLVRRTRSFVRNMQAIGRALRVHEDKRRALVIDYQTMLEGVVDRFVGLGLEDVAKKQGSRLEGVINGGPMTVQRSFQGAVLVGMTMGEERALVCPQKPKDSDLAKKTLLAMAEAGERRPRTANRRNNHTVPQEERLLARKLYHYTTAHSGGSYDPAFEAKLRALRPDWFDKHNAEAKKKQLLHLAKAGKPKPSRSNKDPATKRLAVALYNYVYEGSNVFDEVFTEELKKLRPEWLDRQRVESTRRRAELITLALAAEKKPGYATQMGRTFSRYCKPTSRDFDLGLTESLRKLRPEWFEKTSSIKKQALLAMARQGKPRPLFRANRETERRLAYTLWCYTNPAGKCYDDEFTKTLRKLRPDWLTNFHKAE